MNARIAISAISVFAGLAVMAGATFAFFSTTASNNGNTFASGNMVLEINDVPGTTSSPIFTVLAAAPGDSTSSAMVLKNSGTVSASSVRVVSINVSGTHPDLGDKLTLSIFDDVNINGVLDVGETVLGSGHLTAPGWVNYVLPGITLPGGGSKNLGAKIVFDADADNTYQGKSAEFNLNLQANQ